MNETQKSFGFDLVVLAPIACYSGFPLTAHHNAFADAIPAPR